MSSQPARGENAASRRLRKRSLLWLMLLVWLAVAIWHVIKPMPAGTDVRSIGFAAPAASVDLLVDLTWRDADGTARHEQEIFAAVHRIIDEAHSFIVLDFFLFNESMGAGSAVHRPLSQELRAHLIARRRSNPALRVLLITDPINEVYGGARSGTLDELRQAGVEVITTDLARLRDSNPAYSALWRIFGQWWGNSSEGGWLPNPFGEVPPQITLRSYLALLNFKANHRKVIVADRADGTLAGLVTSANPHDASSAHSNVALTFSGPLAEAVLQSELAVARFSGWRGAEIAVPQMATNAAVSDVRLAYITEGAIREHLVGAINAAQGGDAVSIATFYLADRDVIDALLDAASRGVVVRLILDPNKDAFGREKDGVPNRPVANELVARSQGRIQVRWYATHGEQFHTKLALIRRGSKLIASLGSANLTRRNIGNYNLEANVAVESDVTVPVAADMLAYFERLWNNVPASGASYTVEMSAFHDPGRTRYWRYRLMEWSGLSTF